MSRLKIGDFARMKVPTIGGWRGIGRVTQIYGPADDLGICMDAAPGPTVLACRHEIARCRNQLIAQQEWLRSLPEHRRAQMVDEWSRANQTRGAA